MKPFKINKEPKVPGTSRKMDMKRLFRRNQMIITALAIMIAAAGYLNYADKLELAGAGVNDVYEAGIMDISDEDLLAENQALDMAAEIPQEIASLDQDGEDLENLAAAKENDPASADEAGETELADAGQTGQEDQTGTQLASSDSSGTQLTLEDGEEEAANPGESNPGEAVLTSGMNVSDYISGVQLSREQVRARNKETLMSLIDNPNIEEAAKEQAIQEMIDMTAVAEKENAAETLLQAKGFADPVVSISSGNVDVVINASSITDQQRAQIEDIVKRKTEVEAENIVITLMKLEE